jgi:sterol desaturase/sphingolipid hydroxylase (fatty acid hydroxylase superfamily)
VKRLQHPVLVIAFWASVAALIIASRPSPLAFLGVALWPTVEYVAHRWLMHGISSSRPALYKRVHGVHHLYPGDRSHFTIPLAVTVPLVALLAAIPATLGAWPTAAPVLGGLLAAYALYDIAHLAAHGLAPFPFRRALARYHARHHRDASRAFGVTSPLVDALMGTR